MNRIAELRKAAGISQADLAKRVGIAQAYLSQVENGERAGSIMTFRKIAATLGCKIDDLLTEVVANDTQ